MNDAETTDKELKREIEFAVFAWVTIADKLEEVARIIDGNCRIAEKIKDILEAKKIINGEIAGNSKFDGKWVPIYFTEAQIGFVERAFMEIESRIEVLCSKVEDGAE